MKIRILSDLHLEFGPINLKRVEADVLVLAGDICVANYFKRGEASPYYHNAWEAHDFIEGCLRDYEYVVWVLGNHEHYQGDFTETLTILRAQFPDVIFLDNSDVTVNGVKFFGATMWTDCVGANPVTMYTVEQGLTDYRQIKNGYRKFRAMDTVAEFRKTMRALTSDADVVITHHAPSFRSVHPRYHGSTLNAAYYSDLDNYIHDSNHKLWIHGHMHNSSDYYIGGTRIVCNPRGYYGHELNADFNPDFVVEL